MGGHMFSLFMSYAVAPSVIKAMYLLFLIPVIMAIVAVIVIKKSKKAAEKRFAYDDEMASKRQKEIDAEKALDDDFGDSWHIHSEDK